MLISSDGICACAVYHLQEEVHTQQAFYWQHYRTNRIKEAAAALTQQQGTGQEQEKQQQEQQQQQPEAMVS